LSSAAAHSGQIVVVTGGGSGIGEAVTRLFAERGARVAVLDIDAAAVSSVADDLDRALGLAVDVSDSAAVELAFDKVTELLGPIDAVVHAAGIDDVATKELVFQQTSEGKAVDVVAALSDDQWHRMMSVNLDGAFFVLRAALRRMQARRTGSIVLIGSETGVRGVAGLAHYGASKGGVHALVRSVAKEVACRGVRVNGIAPGVIDTPMSRRSRGAYDGDQALLAPLGRRGRADEIASVAFFLSGEDASYVVGEIINVDGGRTAC
jgi:3-oxoacyl-[acyl-carrier protein] reductase